MPTVKKIAIVVSHPIQHFCPQYASWAKIEGVRLKVFFGSNLGAQTYFDTDFKETIRWNNLYLDEFDHEFVNGDETLPADKNLRADKLGKRLSAFKPDMLVYYGYFQALSAQARQWALKNGVPLAYISDAEFRQRRPLWKRLLKFPFLYFYFKKIDTFLTVGNANESYYHFYGVPAKKMKRMHFSIDLRTYENAWKEKDVLRKQIRDKYQVEEHAIVLSVVGKLVDWKSQDQLIQLLHKLERTQRSQKFCLILAGSGPEEIKWRKLAETRQFNKVVFAGFVHPEALPAIYAATDIYIHPALREPHSLSISEAIYMGCPVLVADTCGSWGIEDDVQEGKNGYVYAHGKLDELQDKLMVLCDAGQRIRMGDYSHQIALSFQALAHGKVLEKL